MSEQNQARIGLELRTYDWEENMFDELSKKYNIPDDVVLNIVMTGIMNEINAMQAGKKCVLVDAMNMNEAFKTQMDKYIASLTPEQRKQMAEAIIKPNS